MSEHFRIEYINHALSEMSSRVRGVYCQQVADFETSIAETELRIASNKEIIAEHQRLCRKYRDRIYEFINRPLPDTLDLAIRNESSNINEFCDFVGPTESFYSKESPLRFNIGKEIYYFCTSLILLENGFFDRRRRQHGGLVDNYIGRAEVIADRWQAAGLGPIATGQSYEFREIDLAAAYFKTIHSVFLGRVEFDSIKQFVRKTIDPAAFVKQFEYDIFVVRDAKTFLQEYMQGVHKLSPTYSIVKQDNRPEHDPLFLASINIPCVGRVEELGRSKYEATMLTAESAIGTLRAQKIPQFLRYEEKQIATVYEFGRPTQLGWLPHPKQLERAARWKRDVSLPFRISDAEVLQCFSTAASQQKFGACPQDNGLRAQIGSHLINLVALTPESSAEDRQRVKVGRRRRRRGPGRQGQLDRRLNGGDAAGGRFGWRPRGAGPQQASSQPAGAEHTARDRHPGVASGG